MTDRPKAPRGLSVITGEVGLEEHTSPDDLMTAGDLNLLDFAAPSFISKNITDFRLRRTFSERLNSMVMKYTRTSQMSAYLDYRTDPEICTPVGVIDEAFIRKSADTIAEATTTVIPDAEIDFNVSRSIAQIYELNTLTAVLFAESWFIEDVGDANPLQRGFKHEYAKKDRMQLFSRIIEKEGGSTTEILEYNRFVQGVGLLAVNDFLKPGSVLDQDDINNVVQSIQDKRKRELEPLTLAECSSCSLENYGIAYAYSPEKIAATVRCILPRRRMHPDNLIGYLNQFEPVD